MTGGARQVRAHVAEEVGRDGAEQNLHHEEQPEHGREGTGGEAHDRPDGERQEGDCDQVQDAAQQDASGLRVAEVERCAVRVQRGQSHHP
jgi:hypothetical protein